MSIDYQRVTATKWANYLEISQFWPANKKLGLGFQDRRMDPCLCKLWDVPLPTTTADYFGLSSVTLGFGDLCPGADARAVSRLPCGPSVGVAGCV